MGSQTSLSVPDAHTSIALAMIKDISLALWCLVRLQAEEGCFESVFVTVFFDTPWQLSETVTCVALLISLKALLTSYILCTVCGTRA